VRLIFDWLCANVAPLMKQNKSNNNNRLPAQPKTYTGIEGHGNPYRRTVLPLNHRSIVLISSAMSEQTKTVEC